MVNNYVTFDDVLKNPCKKVSVEEGKKIAVEMQRQYKEYFLPRMQE